MRLAALAALAFASPAAAAPDVAADIPPTHSLVARVMEGVAAPTLLLDGGVSPHDAGLRPSQARALEGADLVVLNGGGLAPAIERSAARAAEDRILALMALPGTVQRQAAAHDHDDHADHDDHEASEDHDDEASDDHDHADEAAHDDHADGHDHEAAGGLDPHGWLDPRNAALWLTGIAAELARLDPENAAAYARNAAAGAEEIAAAEARAAAALAPFAGTAFVVEHDALGHLTDRFGLTGGVALADTDDAAPTPGQVEAARGALGPDVCLFAEAPEATRVARTAAADSGARLTLIDLRGADLSPGADLYVALIDALAAGIADCLGATG